MAILAFLRDLQRRFATAVVLVHHARKSAATRPGQALRGSSELHAWGDTNLYLRRRKRQILMTVEHRAAAGLNDIELELADDAQGAALRLRQDKSATREPHEKNCERPGDRRAIWQLRTSRCRGRDCHPRAARPDPLAPRRPPLAHERA